MIVSCVLLIVLSGWSSCAVVEAPSAGASCEVVARTEWGPVCGRVREAGAGVSYASFRSVPYAKQPLGELRFKELQPAEPWDVLDATEDGPICPQTDLIYNVVSENRGMSEACIHANIHVPLYALPAYNSDRYARELQSPYVTSYEQPPVQHPGLPILVFIHGGGFAFGSGNSDFHGPERLVSEGVIVVTFNYRLNVFGFLSLNTTNVPGNNGLRDMITLLKWVQRNAQFFGGDPTQVTIGGQSAGAAATHLLTLSDAAQGLYQRAIVMSGSAIPTFYTVMPSYAPIIAGTLLQLLGINSTDPDFIYQELITMPLEKIMAANKQMQDQTGLIAFFPVVESPLPGVTPILEADPEELILRGKGRDIPFLVGYTDVECEIIRNRFEEIDIVSRYEANPNIILPPGIFFSENASEAARRMRDRYIEGKAPLEGYISACTDTYFSYAALKIAHYKQAVGGAPLYLYRFSYTADHNELKAALNLNYTGAAHVEDLTYIFQNNVVPVSSTWSDTYMRWLMTFYVGNFVKTGNPTPDYSWYPVERECFQYLNIVNPVSHRTEEGTQQQQDVIAFIDSIRGISS